MDNVLSPFIEFYELNRKPSSVGCVGIVLCKLGRILVFCTTDWYIKIEFFTLLDGKDKEFLVIVLTFST